MHETEWMTQLTDQKADRLLDCIGLFCPMPILKTREEIDKMTVGEVLTVLTDDPAAEEDFRSWTKRTGHAILEMRKESDHTRIVIRKTK
jgi:TusA-related sulfurtransferase